MDGPAVVRVWQDTYLTILEQIGELWAGHVTEGSDPGARYMEWLAWL